MPDLQLLDRAILLTHVLAGVTALAMAPLALLARKGGTAHRRWGTLYFWAMFAIFASSLAVMTYRPNAFLLCIAVLAFYSAFGGLLGKQALEDLRGFRRPAEDRNWWWYVHMDRMLTSSIAALTAFLVQN